MNRPGVRFPRPLYESLPWLYLFAGLAALAGSYFLDRMPLLTFLLGIAGFVGVVAGIVILLRRRDYRDMRARYKADE